MEGRSRREPGHDMKWRPASSRGAVVRVKDGRVPPPPCSLVATDQCQRGLVHLATDELTENARSEHIVSPRLGNTITPAPRAQHTPELAIGRPPLPAHEPPGTEITRGSIWLAGLAGRRSVRRAPCATGRPCSHTLVASGRRGGACGVALGGRGLGCWLGAGSPPLSGGPSRCCKSLGAGGAKACKQVRRRRRKHRKQQQAPRAHRLIIVSCCAHHRQARQRTGRTGHPRVYLACSICRVTQTPISSHQIGWSVAAAAAAHHPPRSLWPRTLVPRAVPADRCGSWQRVARTQKINARTLHHRPQPYRPAVAKADAAHGVLLR